MDTTQLGIAGIAGVGAGLVNALAGGGTLITFPALMALGLPAIDANVTNTVALSPGYLSATLAQRNDLSQQKHRIASLALVSVAGGLAGAALLLYTGEKAFRQLIPYLILLASLLLAAQPYLRKRLQERAAQENGSIAKAMLPVFLAAVYGGYFGAGLSVIVLAVLGMAFHDSLTRLNALKQAIAFFVNIAAALFFVFTHPVNWTIVAVVAAGALLGGAIGGKLASRIPPDALRAVVVIAGIVIAIVYWVR